MKPWNEMREAMQRARWCVAASLRLASGSDYVLRDAPQDVVEALARRHRQAGQPGAAGLLDAVYAAASVEQQLRCGHETLMFKVREGRAS